MEISAEATWQCKGFFNASSNVKADDGRLACLLQNPLTATLLFLCTHMNLYYTPYTTQGKVAQVSVL